MPWYEVCLHPLASLELVLFQPQEWLEASGLLSCVGSPVSVSDLSSEPSSGS